eukprot:gene7896-1107_t
MSDAEGHPVADAPEQSPSPRSPDEIFEDYYNRRTGLLEALTEDSAELFAICDPAKDNLVLYGHKDGSWSVDLPGEEVPPELPEPCVGINYARDSMSKTDWISLVAVHSDSWLMSVAFFYAVRLEANGRAKLYKQINALPTVFEQVTGRVKADTGEGGGKRQKGNGMQNRPTESTQPSGRIIRPDDMGPQLKGRQAELFWPDDKMWYLVEIQSINLKTKQAKVIYATGEEEEVDMEEIVKDKQMALL